MKTIIDFITEKFKINSKTVTKQDKDVEFVLNPGKFPTKEEIEIIEKLTYKMPILPDKVYTSNSSVIFRYNRSSEKQTEEGYHINNSIRIHCGFVNGNQKFSVFFNSVDKEDPIKSEFSPFDIYYCFKAIKVLWDKIDFSKVIEKYA